MTKKYIDADKLIAEIERWRDKAKEKYNKNPYCMGRCDALAEFRNHIVSLQQEQPEVDLEKFTEKIKTFQGRYKYPEIVSIKGAMAFMARMFYQYPNVAKRWYEQLPKVTMDDARQEE